MFGSSFGSGGFGGGFGEHKFSGLKMSNPAKLHPLKELALRISTHMRPRGIPRFTNRIKPRFKL